MDFKSNIANNKSSQIALIIASLCIYNLRFIIRYYFSETFFNDYEYANLVFTYQKCGFISRGLIPSIYEFLNIDNKFILYIISNIYISMFVVYVIMIGRKYNNIFFTLAVLFSSFGVIHQTTLLLKPDQIVYSLFFTSIFYLLNGKNNIYILISIICMFIHEMSLFIFIPVFYLNTITKRKFFIYTILMCILFLFISLCSTKIPKEKCIQLMQDYTGLINIPKEFYIQRTAAIIENIKQVFTTYNMALASIFLVLLLICNRYIFNKIYLNNKYITDYLFLLPLILCFVAVDWMRWVTQVYLLSIIFLQHKYEINKSVLIKIYVLSFIIGVPNTIGFIFSPLIYLLKIIF